MWLLSIIHRHSIQFHDTTLTLIFSINIFIIFYSLYSSHNVSIQQNAFTKHFKIVYIDHYLHIALLFREACGSTQCNKNFRSPPNN